MDFPFQQENIDGKIRRTFSPDVDVDELKWHQDLTDRKITVIQHGEWEFQMEDDLPNGNFRWKMICQSNCQMPNKFIFRNLFGTELLKVQEH